MYDKGARDQKPYVVSEDIHLLLQGWAGEKGFKLPPAEFFDQLREGFVDYMQQIFPYFELVSEEELALGLKDLVLASGLRPVSLDRVYFCTDPGLDIARLVGLEGEDMGLGRRGNALLLLSQFRNLQKLEDKKIVLVDDVIFTGDLLTRLVGILAKSGLCVGEICAGVGIDPGIQKLQEMGYKVNCVCRYHDVIDEICERDFYPGVPFSGRLLAGEKNIGLPYILPFGQPGEWASIPDKWQEPLSRFCINQTIKLFRAIEECSGKIVHCCDLGRGVIGLPEDKSRYIESLKRLY